MMKAVRAYGPRDFRLEDVAIPKCGPGEVRMRTLAVGVCASDGKMFAGGDLYWGKNGRVLSVPVTPGHEFVGIVDEIGPSEPGREGEGRIPADLKVGDVIVAEQCVPCGKNCWFCQQGFHHKCDSLRVFGQGLDGAMAEMVLLPNQVFIHKVRCG
jgi:threonine dehydrogenase-like Zn-dependent dehydrogenase